MPKGKATDEEKADFQEYLVEGSRPSIEWYQKKMVEDAEEWEYLGYDVREKREAATKVQSQIRGVNARKNKPNNGAKAKEKTTNGEKAGEINARNTRSNDKLKKTIVQLEKELKLAQDQIDELNEKMTGYVCGVLCCVVLCVFALMLKPT